MQIINEINHDVYTPSQYPVLGIVLIEKNIATVLYTVSFKHRFTLAPDSLETFPGSAGTCKAVLRNSNEIICKHRKLRLQVPGKVSGDSNPVQV